MITGIRKNSGSYTSLKDIKPGTEVTVQKIHGEGTLKRHILDMGLTSGCKVLVRRVAPLGDPIQISVRGFEMSLRKADARMIEVM